ncbi:arylacetamide deacetylase-like [Clavelina lepadiformis]|uniref:arylacetamide deacetylase-like n=1 Tax=Clavelina lepadiformis TaxID=159417 RepID=UPI004041E710
MWIKAAAVIFVVAYALYVPLPVGWKPSWRWQLVGGVLKHNKHLQETYANFVGLDKLESLSFKSIMADDQNSDKAVPSLENWDGIDVYVFKPKGDHSGAGIVYLHGGGWVLGDPSMSANLLKSLANYTNAVIVAPNYRKAPQHPFPAAFEDCYDVTARFLNTASEFGVNAKRIAIMGNSAGANLAAAVSHKLCNQKDSPGRPIFQYLLNPPLQFAVYTLPSALEFQHDPMLSKALMDNFRLAYLGYYKNERVSKAILGHGHLIENGEFNKTLTKYVDVEKLPKKFKQNVRESKELLSTSLSASQDITPEEKQHIQSLLLDPTLAPLSASDEELRRLPKTFVVTCGADVLRDEGVFYAQRLAHVGTNVTHIHLDRLPHGFILFSKYTNVHMDEETDNVVADQFSILKKHMDD